MMAILISGLDAAANYIKQVQAGVKMLDGTSVRVSTPLPYAYGIITGFRRDGRVARRAGGSFSLPNALRALRPQIAPTLALALVQGRNAVLSALTSLGLALQQETQRTEVVKSGNLRDSYRVTIRQGLG